MTMTMTITRQLTIINKFGQFGLTILGCVPTKMTKIVIFLENNRGNRVFIDGGVKVI